MTLHSGNWVNLVISHVNSSLLLTHIRWFIMEGHRTTYLHLNGPLDLISQRFTGSCQWINWWICKEKCCHVSGSFILKASGVKSRSIPLIDTQLTLQHLSGKLVKSKLIFNYFIWSCWHFADYQPSWPSVD